MARKFNILKKQNLPDEARIIGFTFLKEPNEKNRKKFDFIEKSNQHEIGCKSAKRKSWAFTRGYVEIDRKPDTFVEVKSRLFLFIILLVGLLLCTTLMFGGKNIPVLDDLPVIGNFDIFDDQIIKPTEKPDNEEIPTITFAGYGKYKVSKDYPSVELKNPEGNFVDMVFTLTDEATGELIARTNKIPAGKFVYVNVMDFYTKPGVYNILIKVATFDAETGTQMNGINQKMEVTVE